MFLLPVPDLVSLDRCAPVGVLLEAASREGEILRAEPTIAGDTVYARFAGLPVAEVRARFARLLHASWTQGRDGSWTLARSIEDRREVREIERDLLLRGLERRLGELPTQAAADPQVAAQSYIAALQRSVQAPPTDQAPVLLGPTDGLLADLLRALGPKGIADALLPNPFGAATAFSDVPTARETPFPTAARSALARYVEVDEAFGRVVGDEFAETLDSWERERIVDAARRVGVSRTLLILNRRGPLVAAAVTTYDATGTTRGSAQIELDMMPDASGATAEGFPFSDPLPPGDEAAIGAIAVRGVIPSPALAPYRDPSVRDPLEIRALPVLRAMRGDLLVALPDRTARETAKTGITTPAAFVAALLRSGVRLRREGDLTIGEPIDPAAFDRMCIDRATLSRWVREGAGRDLSAVRSLGLLYAHGGPAVSYGGLSGWYRDLLLYRIEGRARSETLDSRFLRTIGALSDGEWRTLVGGGSVVVGTPAPRAVPMDEYTRFGSSMLEPVVVERVKGEETKPVADIFLTGTMAFPRGLPAGTRLRLESREEPTFWNPEFKLWVNLDNYLYRLFPRGIYPAETTDAAMAKAVGDFRFDEARRTFHTFRVDYGAPVGATNEMEEEAVRDIRRGVTYSELSEGARAAIRARVELFREFFAKTAAARVKKP